MQRLASAFGISHSVSEESFDETLSETDLKISEICQKEFEDKMAQIVNDVYELPKELRVKLISGLHHIEDDKVAPIVCDIYELPQELRIKFISGLHHIENVDAEDEKSCEIASDSKSPKKLASEPAPDLDILENISSLFLEETIDLQLEKLNKSSNDLKVRIRGTRKVARDDAAKDTTLELIRNTIEKYIGKHNDLVSKFNRIKEDAESEIKDLEQKIANYNEMPFNETELHKIHVKMGLDKDDMVACVRVNDELHEARKQRAKVLKMNIQNTYNNFKDPSFGTDWQLVVYISTYRHAGVQPYLATIGTKLEGPYDVRYKDVPFTEIKVPLALKL